MNDLKTQAVLIEREFLLSILFNFIWINASEIFRYFAFVMPMMRDAFPSVDSVAPMNVLVFLSWAVWDTILVMSATAIAWLSLTRFGTRFQTILITGTGIWSAIFVILWLGLWNMNLATLEIVSLALVLAWLEMVVATFIVAWAINRQSSSV